MTTQRRAALTMSFAALSTLGGCAQQGPLLSRQATLGTLKAGVSHLEFENQQLRRQVADLKTESRQVEDRLVQEEAANGELTARLNDARNVLSSRGELDPDGKDSSVFEPGRTSPRKTLPAGRSSKNGRKPPFAQIPGRIDAAPPSRPDMEDESPAWRTRSNGDPGPQSRRSDPGSWLPVARRPEADAAERR